MISIYITDLGSSDLKFCMLSQGLCIRALDLKNDGSQVNCGRLIYLQNVIEKSCGSKINNWKLKKK